MLKCPKCWEDADGEFVIKAIIATTVNVDNEGTVLDEEGDSVEWDDDSSCQCRDCLHIGTVKDFETEERPC